MQRRSNTAFSKHFSASTAEEEDEDDWSEYNSLESLDEGDLEEIQVRTDMPRFITLARTSSIYPSIRI